MANEEWGDRSIIIASAKSISDAKNCIWLISQHLNRSKDQHPDFQKKVLFHLKALNWLIVFRDMHRIKMALVSC